ncbi:MAG: TetR/AcrR family transcriptional regulator [Rhizobiaceae bacterium]
MARTAGSTGEKTSQAVEKAALELFARHGYAAVSMRQIASEVGVQPGALYNHFPAKQDLLLAVMRNHMHRLLEAWELESRRFSSARAAFEGFVRFHLRYHLDKPDAVFVSYMELRSLEPQNFREIEGMRRYYEGFLRKIISRGVDDGIFEAVDVPVAAMAIISMLTGVTTWYKAGGRLDARDVENIYLDMALRSVGVATELQAA